MAGTLDSPSHGIDLVAGHVAGDRAAIVRLCIVAEPRGSISSTAVRPGCAARCRRLDHRFAPRIARSGSRCPVEAVTVFRARLLLAASLEGAEKPVEAALDILIGDGVPAIPVVVAFVRTDREERDDRGEAGLEAAAVVLVEHAACMVDRFVAVRGTTPQQARRSRARAAAGQEVAIGIEHGAIGHGGVAEDGAMEVGGFVDARSRQIGVDEATVAEIDCAQVGAGEIGVAEVRAAQVRALGSEVAKNVRAGEVAARVGAGRAREARVAGVAYPLAPRGRWPLW